MKGALPVAQMKECPKCGYALSPGDRPSGPDSECPRCGVIFRKREESIGGHQREPVTNGIVEDMEWSRGMSLESDERLRIDEPSRTTTFTKWEVSWKFYTPGRNTVYRCLRFIVYLLIVNLFALFHYTTELGIVDHSVFRINTLSLTLGLADVIFGVWLLVDTYRNWIWVEPTLLEPGNHWTGRILGESGTRAFANIMGIFVILSGSYLLPCSFH